ncbi:haloalkane dehalogenase 2 [gamma proteobacterium NOR5-3]|nr:haloalkane dehalogenase 2 [gamma proteobacterium NOR5-3]
MSKRYSPPPALYPFESRWLDVDGHQLHYIDEGPRDAPVLLMVHGNPTWSFYYRKLVLRLRDRYRCIALDHIGCGLSDKPDDAHYDYHLAQRIADLDALVQATIGDQTPLSLVVHDWGGMIGFAWAAQRVERIERCVILNTAAFPMPADKKFPFALWLGGRTALGAFLIRGVNAFSAMAARIAFKKPVSKDVRSGYTGPYNSWKNRIATVRFVQDIPLEESDRGYPLIADTAAQLHRFADKPALLVWGLKDFVFDETFYRDWQRYLPNAELHPLADCGHYVLEDGGEPLLDKIDAFLASTQAALAGSDTGVVTEDPPVNITATDERPAAG